MEKFDAAAVRDATPWFAVEGATIEAQTFGTGTTVSLAIKPTVSTTEGVIVKIVGTGLPVTLAYTEKDIKNGSATDASDCDTDEEFDATDGCYILESKTKSTAITSSDEKKLTAGAGTTADPFDGYEVVLRAGATYTYTGTTVSVPPSDVVVRKTAAPNDTLIRSGNYSLGIKSGTGIEAGDATGTLVITGLNNYDGGQIEKTFPIAKKDVVRSDFTVTPSLPRSIAKADFAAATFTATVISQRSKLGDATFKFNGLTLENAKIEVAALDATAYYNVTVDFAATITGGSDVNFNAATGISVGLLTVKVVGAGTTELADGVVTWAPTGTALTFGDTLKLTKPTITNTATNGTLQGLGWQIYDKDMNPKLDTTWSKNLATPPAATDFPAASWLSTGTFNATALYVDASAATKVPSPTSPVLDVAGSPYLVAVMCTTWAAGRTGDPKVKELTTTVTVSRKTLTSEMITINGSYSYIAEPLLVSFDVKNGALRLAEGDDYLNKTDPDKNLTHAGTGTLIIEGTNNYIGNVSKDFTIAKAALTLDLNLSSVTPREYNGTRTVEDKLFDLRFNGLKGGEAFEVEKDYTIASGLFATADVGERKDVSGTVSLLASGPKSKNYTLTGTGAFTLSQAGTISLNQLTKPDELFNFTIPKNHYFTGKPRGIGGVSFKSGVDNGTGTFVVKYRYTSANPFVQSEGDATWTKWPYDTTIAPTGKVGGAKYPVVLHLTRGTNIDPDLDQVQIGEYEILAPEAPVLEPATTGGLVAKTTRQGVPVTLTVNATSKNECALDYKWYTYSTSASTSVKTEITSGVNGKTYTYPASTMGTFYIGVDVSTASTGIQQSVTTSVGPVAITVDVPPIPFKSARIELAEGSEFVYNGSVIEPSGAIVTVYTTVGTGEEAQEIPLPATEYDLTYANNTNAGVNTAKIIATGSDRYSGVATLNFTIKKKELDAFDMKKVLERQYIPDSLKLGAKVEVADTKSGLGKVTTYYDGDTVIPLVVGQYPLTVDVEEGANLTAGTDIFLGVYKITKRIAEKSDFTYDLTRQKFEDKEYSIAVSVKESAGIGYGDLKVLYDGYADLPKAIGKYVVSVVVSGGDNFIATEVELGEFEIYDVTGIAESNRDVKPVVKAPVEEIVTIAPVKVVAKAAFTAGPIPVSKSGAISFFYAKQVKSGKLFIYSQSGKLVKKVAVSAVSGKVATWDLSGSGVAEGVYVAKGVLTAKDGTKEKVSVVFSVVK